MPIVDVILENHWKVECWRQGELVWTAEFDNLVPTAGLNKLLDATFKTGLASPTWYVGLINTGATFALADTMSSHGGWTESIIYSQTVRPSFTPGTVAAGAVNNSAAKASFTITSGGTLAGAFLTDSNAKGGTSGTLYGEGNFDGGDQVVAGTDIVNVTVTLSATGGSATGFMPIKEEVFGTYHP